MKDFKNMIIDGKKPTKQEMEDLWMYSIKSLFEVKTEVFKK